MAFAEKTPFPKDPFFRTRFFRNILVGLVWSPLWSKAPVGFLERLESTLRWVQFGERLRGNTMRGNKTESLWGKSSAERGLREDLRKPLRGTLAMKTKSTKGTNLSEVFGGLGDPLAGRSSFRRHSILSPSFRGLTKGWFPKGWFWRMFPRNENRNKGTFAKATLLRNRPFISQWAFLVLTKGGFQKGGFGGCSPGTKTGTRVRSPKPPFYESTHLSPSDHCVAP